MSGGLMLSQGCRGGANIKRRGQKQREEGGSGEKEETLQYFLFALDSLEPDLQPVGRLEI